MNRAAALEIVRRYARKDSTVRHLVSVEGVMRALARGFGEDPERWGIAGLFHDLDQEVAHDDMACHGHQTVPRLREEGSTTTASSMPFWLTRTSGTAPNSWRAPSCTPTGWVTAGRVRARPAGRRRRNEGLAGAKKLKQRAFAPGAERDKIHGVEDAIGVPLDEFMAFGISGFREVAPDIGLR